MLFYMFDVANNDSATTASGYVVDSLKVKKTNPKKALKHNCVVPLRKCCAPSKHSGESSLSPNDPSSSLTMMSAFSGAAHSRMSHDTTVT